MAPNTCSVSFPHAVLCGILHAQLETYWSYKDVLSIKRFLPLLEISFLWFRAVCEIWMESYGSRHALQPFSTLHFVCIYTHNSKITGCIQMFLISHECSAIMRYPVPVLGLNARYDWLVMLLKTHCSVFPVSHLCHARVSQKKP